MTLRFPVVKDVPLSRSPLTEVICQVRFPTFLSIGGRGLMQFQEAIRLRFPEFVEPPPIEIKLNAGGSQQSLVSETVGQVFQFRTADASALTSLSTDAYAYSTEKYSVWNDFANDLTLIHYAATSAYKLPYAKRIGLRYVNQIAGREYGIDTLKELSTLLRPELVGLVETDAWSEPEELVTQTLFHDLDDGRMVMRLGLRSDAVQGPLILLDYDYYVEGQQPLDNLIERCETFHDVIYRAFRWSVRDKALKYFKPA